MRLLCGIVALTVLSMFAVALVTDHMANSYVATSAYNQSSHVHLINQVTVALKRAQDCRADYLATGKPANLAAYHAASADVDTAMDRLVNEDYEVTDRLAHAQGLRQFVHQKLSEIGRLLETRTAPPPAVDHDLNRIQRLLGSLAQEESSDISEQLQAAQERTAFHRNLVIAIAVINVLFLAGVAFCAIQIGKLHSLITMCAWSKRVQYKGQWVPLEEYMQNRFGIRISHGISKDEYDKWAAESDAEAAAKALRAAVPPEQNPEPKAAA
jgi:CHASE3 domain sensor protein